MKTNTTQLAAARRAIEAIAMREGISVEEVRREISLAILMAQPKDASIVLCDSVRRISSDPGGVDRLLCFETVNKKAGLHQPMSLSLVTKTV